MHKYEQFKFRKILIMSFLLGQQHLSVIEVCDLEQSPSPLFVFTHRGGATQYFYLDRAYNEKKCTH